MLVLDVPVRVVWLWVFILVIWNEFTEVMARELRHMEYVAMVSNFMVSVVLQL